MKLSDYIKHLQDFLDKEGDLPVIYAKDDEGNGYQKVDRTGTLFYVEDIEEYYLEVFNPEDVWDDGGDYDKVICIN